MRVQISYHNGTRVGPVRIHHGIVGALMAVAGAVLAWHDRRDFPWTHDR